MDQVLRFITKSSSAALLVFGLALPSILTGCATLRKVHDSWIGQPLIKLERHPQFGVPAQKSTLSDGSMAYIYEFGGPVITSSKGFGWGQHLESRQIQCTRTFIIKDDVIRDLMVKGDCGGFKEMYPDAD